jgi:polysaccharide biosynthesis protein PslH
VKVLVLTSRLPYPPFRGDKLKIYNLIRQLSRNHDIALVSFIQRRSEERWIPELKNYCRSVEVVHLSRAASLWNCIKAIPRDIPFQVAYFESPAMVRKVREVEASLQPDILHTHLIRMALYTANNPRTGRVLDLTDAVSLYLDRFMKAQRSLFKRAALRLELRRMLRFEPVIARFDRALVCSAVDKEALEGNVPGARISIVENGVDLEQFGRPDGRGEVDPFRIIYTGNMSYYPNADGAKFLVNDILPSIKKVVPEAKVYVVGQNPPRAVRALARKDVVITGFVRDIRAEYLKSAVAVSPVRFGAGTLNKILEPIALGIPVVTTSTGVEGLGLIPGKDILVSDDSEGFARHVIALLTDQSLRATLVSGAPDKVRSRFGWENIARTLEGVYAEVGHADRPATGGSQKQ